MAARPPPTPGSDPSSLVAKPGSPPECRTLNRTRAEERGGLSLRRTPILPGCTQRLPLQRQRGEGLGQEDDHPGAVLGLRRPNPVALAQLLERRSQVSGGAGGF